MKVSKKKPKPLWIELAPAGEDGIPLAIFVMPIGRKTFWKARHAASAVYGSLAPLESTDVLKAEQASEELDRELIRLGLLGVSEEERAWKGVLDDDDQPLPVTLENIDLALDDDEFFEPARSLYAMPYRVKELEKNGFASGLNGTGAEATPGSDTATSLAASTAESDAGSVPTASTKSPPSRRKRSGKS